MPKVIDLFAGCGGLALGFKQAGFATEAFVEWDKRCVETLKANFERKDSTKNPIFFHTDIRQYDNYLYNVENSLSHLRSKNIEIDGVIGGPPCQAYSLAGRVRDPNGMRDDYRNYLFESYCVVLSTIKPKFFVFENVLGMLSSQPNGDPIVNEVQEGFENAGYHVGKISREIVYDFSNFGGPQRRKRVIIFGVRSDIKNASDLVAQFHDNMKMLMKPNTTVQQAIGDLPKLYPLPETKIVKGNSHKFNGNIDRHTPRYHNPRDIEIFRLLAEDAKSTKPRYNTVEKIKRLYEERVGRKSNVHKYYVLRANEPSNLIPAHLYKDGLRHIHPDPKQARSITVREAARLQSFPDDFKFIGSMGDAYKMIGNAVPPLLGKCIGNAILQTDIFKKFIPT